ncbi:MAG: DUF6252 family protein [Candidatus Kapaibacterium sp.]
MKRSLFLIPVAAIGLVMFSSCKQSTSPGGGGGNQVAMTATVNGKAWSGIVPFTGYNNGYLDFSAGDSISDIWIYYTQKDTGTYPVNGNTGDDLFATYDLRQLLYVSYANSGSVHFTRLDTNHVTGTFNFKAINNASPFDTVTITNGTFDIAR